MAKLCAHGTVLGTVYTLTAAKRYMSDGVVLKNSGFGWKLCSKVKAGVDPRDVLNRRLAQQEETKSKRPAYWAYRAALHDLAGLGKRWKLHNAVELMHDDADGVWSEACDGYGDNVHADVDEVSALCRAYQAALAESAAEKTATMQAAA